MAYIPPMTGYKPFYIQASTDTAASDTTVWGLVAKSNPYPALPNAQEPYKTEWKDRDGDDEHTASMHYKSLEFSVKFYVKTYATATDSAVKVLHSQLDSFFAKIKQGDFKIYDAYTGIGRQRVRYVGYKEDGFVSRDNWAKLTFEASFKCNDPITRMKLNNGSIVTE